MRFFWSLIFVLGLILPTLCQKAVLCYWTSWSSTLSNSNPSLCTHLSYAFVHVDSNGVLNDSDGGMNSFKSLKGSYPNVKLLFSIGGATYNAWGVFSIIAANSTLRSSFAANVLTYCEDKNLDGVDVDWEYPDNQANNFVLLLEELYNLLHPKGYLVTIAVAVDNSWAPYRYDVPNIAKYVDYVNLMTYDYHGSWESSTGINAPLYSNTNTIYTVDKTTQDWISKIGSNKNKLLLGIPLYGPVWTLTSSNTGVGAPGYASFDSPFKYNKICENIKNGWTRVWDNKQKVPYAYGNNQWVGYDDAQSIQEKINYINENEIGGAFFWEMSMDDYSGSCGSGKYPLMTLVKNAFTGGSVDTTSTSTTLLLTSTTSVEAPTTTSSQVTLTTTNSPTRRSTATPTSTKFTSSTSPLVTTSTSSPLIPTTTTRKVTSSTTSPLITTSTTVTTSTKAQSTTPSAQFVCPATGMFKDPLDCKNFYNCAWATATPAPIKCPNGLRWNDTGKYCDWPYNVKC